MNVEQFQSSVDGLGQTELLHEHVNWKQRDTLAVARRIVSRGWATQELARLSLTPLGRLEALAAIGPSTPQSVI